MVVLETSDLYLNAQPPTRSGICLPGTTMDRAFHDNGMDTCHVFAPRGTRDFKDFPDFNCSDQAEPLMSFADETVESFASSSKSQAAAAGGHLYRPPQMSSSQAESWKNFSDPLYQNVDDFDFDEFLNSDQASAAIGPDCHQNISGGESSMNHWYSMKTQSSSSNGVSSFLLPPQMDDYDRSSRKGKGKEIEQVASPEITKFVQDLDLKNILYKTVSFIENIEKRIQDVEKRVKA
jgi:hypothetical protein